MGIALGLGQSERGVFGSIESGLAHDLVDDGAKLAAQGGDGDRSGAPAQALEPGDAFGGGNDLLGNLHGGGRRSGKHRHIITCAYEE